MTYIVQEIQTTNGTTALVTPQIFTDRNQADSAYFTVLAAAAISQVEEHSVLMYMSDGKVVRCDGYNHTAQE